MRKKIENQDTEKENEEQQKPRTIITSNNSTYTEAMLLNRLAETGLLDDYISGSEITKQSVKWVESFSRDDLVNIFTTFPNVYARCIEQMSKTLGPSVKDTVLFNEAFCNLFENILNKAKNIHLKHKWAFSGNTPQFHEFEFALFLFHTFVEEDYQVSTPKDSSLMRALNRFADSDFVNLRNIGAPIYSQLNEIIEHGTCSAGLSEQLSKIYTAMMLARALLFYGNVLKQQRSEHCSEHNDSKLWNYPQAAAFFKVKKEIKKEMKFPLYHGNIDTEAAKCLLTNPGDYLARYSSSQKKYYFTILLEPNIRHNKIVLNFVISTDKVKSWIQNPIENHAEIECYIKEQLSMEQPKNIQPYVTNFLLNEKYSPVFNPICNADMLNASLRAG
ncbi:hypothetical protein [Legionella sp. WA2022007384]